MDEAAITRSIAETLDGVDILVADGNSFFFYDPGGGQPVDQRFPFATLVTNDLYDQVSNLNRPGVFRLNIGVSGKTFARLFGTDGGADGAYDFTVLDQIMPHPVYGQMHWVCVLSPSDATFEAARPLLAEAHALAARRYAGQQPPET
jgi:hypothetical protein